MIADTITQKIGEALKAHDELRLSTLRMLSSALNYEFIAKQHKLSEEEELVVVKREAKKRTDAIEGLKTAQNRPSTSTAEEIVAKLKKEATELEILKEYLPTEMPEEELAKLVDVAIAETGASEIKDMGRVIGAVMARAKGTANGAKVAEMVKVRLT